MFDTSQTAVFYGGTDDNPEHRVWLRRPLREGKFKPCVIGLHNPSIAGKVRNDPTALRGIGIALRLDCSDLSVVNAATLIATKASAIPIDADLNCPWSDWAFKEAARLAVENDGYLIAAWGAPKGRAAVQRKIAARYEEIKSLDLPWSVMRLTASGYPEHPLYLSNALVPVEWDYRNDRR